LNKVRANFKDNLSYYEIAYFLKDYINKDSVVVCIGTDRCIGDCLGPLVGTLLKTKNYPLNVYGTIEDPIHALNIDKQLQQIKKAHPNSSIIGVDACLGDINNIGEIQARDYPIHPGKGVGKRLPEVGDVSIIGIVDSSDNNELFTNRNIRLSLIMNMAKVITHALIHSYYLSNTDNIDIDSII
jgi:putative sporulation protein YyaC